VCTGDRAVYWVVVTDARTPATSLSLLSRAGNPHYTLYQGYIDRSDRAGRLTQDVPAKLSPAGTLLFDRNGASMQYHLVNFSRKFTPAQPAKSNFHWLEA
jgi:hypothetical protein